MDRSHRTRTMRRRELLRRRALPAILAVGILILVLIPLLRGAASAAKEASRILGTG